MRVETRRSVFFSLRRGADGAEHEFVVRCEEGVLR